MNATSAANHQLLIDAIARNAAIVLSLPSAGLARHYKSRFLGESAEGIWVESVEQEISLIRELIGSRQPGGVAFRSGPQKVVFAAELSRHSPDYTLSEGIKVAALLILRPTEIKAVQRRSTYRVGIHETSGLSVRVWRLPEHAYLPSRPSVCSELTTEPAADPEPRRDGRHFPSQKRRAAKGSVRRATADRIQIRRGSLRC